MDWIPRYIGMYLYLYKEVGEEPAKMDWTCRKNGRGTNDEESGCAWSGG